jgi:tetratricopeptide (TPR) repeat protein
MRIRTATLPHTLLFCLVFVAPLVGCGGQNNATGRSPTSSSSGGEGTGTAPVITNPDLAAKFTEAADEFSKNDGSGWDDEKCSRLAAAFEQVAAGQENFAVGYYNAGLSLERCGKQDEAKAKFEQALKVNPKFHQARTKLAVYAFAASGEKDFDAAIAELKKAGVEEAQFKNPEALVHLGMVYLKRNKVADEDGLPNDVARAKLFAQRSLAIDDSYMPAYNLLSLVYFEAAKQKAGKATSKAATSAKGAKKVDTQALELAALVCSQAILKNPKYAPIHNTAGMIQVELQNLNSAVSEFNTARTLDPQFYEAQMNFAAVNLQFRGFEQAEGAYRKVLEARPNDYDARLGLALAIRGRIDDTNSDKFVADAAEQLKKAKEIAPQRPEAYFNDGILTQEYKAKSGGAEGEKLMLEAKKLYEEFVAKAGAASEFADGVKQAKERMGEIDQIIAFNKQTEAQRKAAEAEAKVKAAEAEAKGEEGAPTEQPAPK